MQLTKHKFYPALAGLRVVLASLVFLYHFHKPENPNVLYVQPLVILRYRMTIFFVLSGFVIMLSLLPKNKLSASEYTNFIISKIIRLFPLYLLLLIVPYFDVGIPPLAVFLVNISLTKGFFRELFLSGIGPAWSLTTELTFYCLVPFILYYAREKKKLLISYLLIILIGLLLTLLGTFLTYLNLNPYGFFSDISFTLNTTFFGRATDFYVGITLACFIYKHPDKEILLANINKTYLGIFLIVFISSLIHYFDNMAGKIAPILSLVNLYLFLPFAAGCFLFGLVREKTIISNFLSLKWMIALGNASYGFYLMHASWLQFKISKINPFPDHGYFLLWLTAVLTYYFFEKPATTFLRRHLNIS